MMNRPLIGLLVLLTSVLFGLAFQEKGPITKGQLIRERLDSRVQKYRTDAARRCLEDLLEEATVFVDSVLIEEARRRIDTIQKPDKPFKPDRPEAVPGRDSLPVAPLLQDTLN
ncbi:MAG: hypothetical protein AAGH79_08270 [Bacteroidota bacterium]